MMDHEEYGPIFNTLDAISLTIELDNDVNYEDDSENEENRIPWHRPRLIQFLPLPVETRISDLSVEARELLLSHLSLPTMGTSMKNWESIGHFLGMSVDTIMALKQGSHPCDEMLKRNRKEPMFRLIAAIENAQRMDTLYSLLNLAKHQKLIGVTPPREDFYGNDTASASYDDSAVGFILVTHFESTKEEKRMYKWLMKNLIKSIDERYRILDIDDAIQESNVGQSTSRLFEGAQHIVVVFNESYLKLDDVTPKTNLTEAKKCLNSLMDNEYFQNQSNNYRFRQVVFPRLGVIQLPKGWATSSNPYQFPEMADALFGKLLKPSLKP